MSNTVRWNVDQNIENFNSNGIPFVPLYPNNSDMYQSIQTIILFNKIKDRWGDTSKQENSHFNSRGVHYLSATD